MNKQNLLFDATGLVNYFEKNSSRSGIFFTAFNIFKGFVDFDYFNITLLFHQYQKRYYARLKKNPFFSRFTYIFCNDYYTKRHHSDYIEINKKYLKDKNINFPVKIFKCVKIIYNYFRILLCSINKKDISEKILNRYNLYLSVNRYIPKNIQKNENIKKYIILYDITPVFFPKYYPDLFKTDNFINEYAELGNLNKNNNYICISENTRNDYLKCYGSLLNKDRLFVACIASAQVFFPNYDKEKLCNVFKKYNVCFNSDKKYIFSLCTLEPRKNLIFTVKCFIKFINKHKIQDLYFYLGGGQWDIFISQLEEQIENLDEYSGKVVKLGYIEDEDINILYSNSLFFVYLSQYEGFGMPPLEAMQSGTPVITSNNSSLPEVVGDAAIMIDYDSEEQCIKAFEDLYFNDDLRKDYIQKGLERSKLFTWEKTVNNIKDIMQL